MDSTDLLRFITENDSEWRWEHNEGGEDVLLFINRYEIIEFNELVKESLSDGGRECTMMDGYFVFWMNDICEYYGIDTGKVFPQNNE